jgi:hypothetical protein
MSGDSGINPSHPNVPLRTAARRAAIPLPHTRSQRELFRIATSFLLFLPLLPSGVSASPRSIGEPTNRGECEAGASAVDMPASQLPETTSKQWRSVAPRLIPAGSNLVGSSSALQVSAEPAPKTSYVTRKFDDSLQIIGHSALTGLLSFNFVHSTGCGSQQSVRLQHSPDGGRVEVSNGSEEPFVYELASPWAVDATGRELATWFESDGTTLRQIVDARGATAPVVFDPTYSAVSCTGYSSDGDAALYMNVSTADPADCPVLGMLRAVRQYTPVWGFEENVANDYGKLMIKERGECSVLSDTGPSWDFQVPCKAHDYCYDLRRAGFTGTVSDADCDGWFFNFMEAHCNDRSTQFAKDTCRRARNGAYNTVRLPWVNAQAQSGLVTIRNYETGKCADVAVGSGYAGTGDQGAFVQQWRCAAVDNQRFRIVPVEGNPPYFYIRAEHSGQCLGVRVSEDVTQEGCLPFPELQMRIRSSRNENAYTISPQATPTDCWHLRSHAFTDGIRVDHPVCDRSSNWYLWRIIEVA